MKLLLRWVSVVALSSSLIPTTLGSNPLLNRDLSTDVCAEVDSVLKVPNKFLPGFFITLGTINACLCISSLPEFMATNIIAISATALAGKAAATAAVTDLIKAHAGPACHYPTHSLPVCKHGSPCSFTCKDGYSASPSGDHPTQCICKAPYKECNGKCGLYYSCPSHHYKREALAGDKRCPQGLSVCGVLGRSTNAWDCVDTQSDLESCGGCAIPLRGNGPHGDGEDCTSLPGVSDVSCIRGECMVHRCMPGYDIHMSGSACVYSEEKDPVLLAAQYGLEHVPL